jgi:glutamate-1-semialdehyde 2,1-aminomutase
VTFEGHYHGWSETVFRAVLPGALEHTLQIPFNDPEAATVLFERYGDRIAGVVLEPVMANSGVVPPIPGFLQHLRDLTVRHGALLIFDEVITGLRVGRESAQGRYGVTPDLTILSKVLGGGFPVAAFGGSREVMAPLADGRAMHAGVYAGNHAALRAVVATLRKIQRETDMYERLESLGAYTESALRAAFAAEGRDVLIGRVGSVMAVSLLTRPVEITARRAEISAATDSQGHQRLQMFAQAEGVYFHPIPHETWFLSTAHTFDHVDKAVSVIRRGLAQTA